MCELEEWYDGMSIHEWVFYVWCFCLVFETAQKDDVRFVCVISACVLFLQTFSHMDSGESGQGFLTHVAYNLLQTHVQLLKIIFYVRWREVSV